MNLKVSPDAVEADADDVRPGKVRPDVDAVLDDSLLHGVQVTVVVVNTVGVVCPISPGPLDPLDPVLETD